MLSRAQIKYIHSLRLKKYRQKYSRFVAEGVKVVEELLRERNIVIDTLYATAPWCDSKGLSDEPFSDITVVQINEQELHQIAVSEAPQQVIAVCQLPEKSHLPDLSGKVSLALETIQDPGNLGTIIRIADWFGIENVICSPDCVDAFNPKCIQATMGSIARVKITEMALEELSGKIPIYAASLSGKDISKCKPVQEGIILIGNEGHGLSEKVLQMATHCITIPRIGKAESLNAAVATGIICDRLIL
jgi:TrmH family RNA methyltransferase